MLFSLMIEKLLAITAEHKPAQEMTATTQQGAKVALIDSE
jgi:hypothetical protein